MIETSWFVAGFLLGAIAAWLAAASRSRAVGEAMIGELRRQVAAGEAEVAKLRADLQAEQRTRVTAETRLEESVKNIVEQKKLLEDAEKKLKDAFAALSVDSLRQNSEAFAKQAAEKVRPLAEALQRYEAEIKQIEKARQTAYGSLNEQLKSIATTHHDLSKETTNLVHALRKPEVKGRWGELQLKRTVEAAGLSPHCDFIEQYSVDTEEGRRRPDLIVKLPGDRAIVVDSKVSTNAYVDALHAEQPEAQHEHLVRYARAIRTHIQGLASKAYWDQFEQTPDFVVMFVPGESFFSAALEQDHNLIEEAMASKVILASPTTLIALLRTVAYSWRQQELIENARQIGKTAQFLFERVCKFAEHLGRIGDNLRRATEAYNDAVGSWERRVLPMGRRIGELGVTARQAEFTEMKPVDALPRPANGQAAANGGT